MVPQAGALQSASDTSKGSSPSCLQFLENSTRCLDAGSAWGVIHQALINARFGRSRERMELMEWFGWQGMLKLIQSHLAWTPSTSCSKPWWTWSWSSGVWSSAQGTPASVQRGQLPNPTFQSSFPSLNYILSHRTLLWDGSPSLFFSSQEVSRWHAAPGETETEDYFVPNQLTFGKV